MTKSKTETAVLGAGCFWKPQFLFEQLPGIIKTEVGYSGGYLAQPTYRQVCYEDTGHAEVTKVEFDPNILPYTDLLDAFFEMHDPRQVNRQGLDIGSQYEPS